MNYILVFIVVAAVIYLCYKIESTPEEKKNEKIIEQTQDKKIEMPYESKFLLTKSEYSFYNILKQKCDANNLLICPKVRLEDFINVKVNNYKELQKYRGYIKARHVDFIICDSKLRIKAAVELDDKTHETNKAIKTDNFKNELFNTIKIKLYRIKTNSIYDQEIDNIIKEIKETN